MRHAVVVGLAALLLAGCGGSSGYMKLGHGKLARDDAEAFTRADRSCDDRTKARDPGSPCYVSKRRPE
jgi:hypothetical protein